MHISFLSILPRGIGSLITFFCLSLIPHQVLALDFSKGLEQLVLCKQTEAAKKVVEEIKQGKGVKPDGDFFYKPTQSQKVFGYPIKYIGLSGVMLVPGPNVVLKAQANKVLEKLSKLTQKSFKPMEYWQETQAGQHTRILIFPDPKKPKLSYIQCGYFGP